jgi:S-DNA-T family DNA segregation ATPase FtsK/SpoIIIE
MPARSPENAPDAAAAPGAEGTATIARRLVGDLFAAGASPGSTPELEVIAGPEPGLRLALTEAGRPYLVGRGTGCALPLVVDEISREHAVFVWTAEGVLVRDLGSKNGVVVGGARIASERRLRHGDLVEIGPVTLRLRDPVDRYLAELAGGSESLQAAGSSRTADTAPERAREPAARVAGGSRTGILLTGIAIGALLAAVAGVIAMLFG